MEQNFSALTNQIKSIQRVTLDGSVVALGSGCADVSGLSRVARIGDMVRFKNGGAKGSLGEILSLERSNARILPEKGLDGLALNDAVVHLGRLGLFPCKEWIGRIVDPFLRPLDGRILPLGDREMSIMGSPPPASQRQRLGSRLRTGLNGIDTLLPIVRGQRIGLFAGSGVGKSTLLADLAKGMESDCVVLALIGERGRELRSFVEDTLGHDGMKRSFVVAATADQSPVLRRRCAWTAMAAAEYFRDAGHNVLFLMDSVTRFAEAHKEIAASLGEVPSLDGFPASTPHELMTLSERAGPGGPSDGSITAIFSVLVAGSDMEGTIADILRGSLDGHFVLDRAIAEKGRFPAIDFLRSLSRSLPDAATTRELETINSARRVLRLYEDSELLIQSGLYQSGSSPSVDRAIVLKPKLDVFLSGSKSGSIEDQFSKLDSILLSIPEETE